MFFYQGKKEEKIANFFERKKKRLIFKEFVAVDSVKKDAGKIKEKGISIQMRIQKNKGKKIFLHSPCEKEEPFGE